MSKDKSSTNNAKSSRKIRSERFHARVSKARQKNADMRFVVHATGYFAGLTFRIACICLTFGFIAVLWSNEFHFHEFMEGLVSQNYAVFDFAQVTTDISNWVNSLPDAFAWFGVIAEPIAYFGISLAYITGFVLQVFTYVF